MDTFNANKIKHGLVIVMALGLVIRLVAASLQPNYIDEGFNYYICQQGWQSMYDHLKIDVHTPLVHLLNYPITQLTSDIFWMRLLGVICGTLNIGVAFVLLRRFIGPQLSLWIAAFLACDFALWQSDALFRPYAILALGISLVGLGMVDILRVGKPFSAQPQVSTDDGDEQTGSDRWRWAGFFLACMATACSHMLGILALVPCFIWSFFAADPARKRALVCIALGVLPSLVWFAVGPLTHHPADDYINNVTNVKWFPFFEIPCHIFNLTTLPFLYQGDSDSLAVFLNYCSDTISPWLNVLLFAIFAWGGFVLWKKFPKEGSFLCMLVILPLLLLALAIAIGKMKLFQSHYTIPFTAIILLIPTVALHERLMRSLLTVLTGVTILITALFPGNRMLWVQDWGSAFDFISARQNAGDHIGVNIAYTLYSFALAYDGDNIHFNYDKGVESIEYNPPPGKLSVLPLRLPECNQTLLDFLGSGNLFLVLCESDLENKQVPLWLNQYYEVVEGAIVPNINYWGRLTIFQLRRRPVPTPPIPSATEPPTTSATVPPTCSAIPAP